MPDVIIPVLDEAGALPGLLARFPAGYRPLVVDNGSTDGSAEIAAACGATVVVEPRRGFGAACSRGLTAAEPTDGVVCLMDCDGSLDPADLPRVADPVLAADADLVLGARRPTAAGAWPLHARVANATLAWHLRRRAGLQIRDLGPMRAARCAPLRVAAGDGGAGGGGGLAAARGPGALRAADWPIQGDRDRAGHPAGRRRH